MDGPVPCHVDEADELVAVPGADPTEAMPVHLALPVVLEYPMVERLSMERVHRCVVEVATPVVRECHDGTVSRGIA